MKKEELSDARAEELVEWWGGIQSDSESKRLWLDVYEHHDVTSVTPHVRARIELIAQIIRRTIPKKEGGVDAT